MMIANGTDQEEGALALPLANTLPIATEDLISPKETEWINVI